MPTVNDDVCSSGQTGSHRRTLRTTQMPHSGHHGGGEAAASGDDDKASSGRWHQKLALNDRHVPMSVYILAAAWAPSAFQQFGAYFKDKWA